MAAASSGSDAAMDANSPGPLSRQPRLLRLRTHASFLPEQFERDRIEASRNTTDGNFFTALRRRWSHWKQNDGHWCRSLVISATGEYIAVLDRFDATFLTGENGFKEPIGSSTGLLEAGFYTSGVWIDEIRILAAATSNKWIFFLDVTGKKLYNISMDQCKAKGHIVGMFTKQMPHTVSGKRLSLVILTSDCALHHIEMSSEGFCEADLKDIKTIVHTELKKIHPHGITCYNYNAEKSMLAMAGPSSVGRISRSAGKNCISIWQTANLLESVELLGYSTQLDGSYPSPWMAADTANYVPFKLIISPGFKYAGLLDCRGRMQLVSVNQGRRWSLQKMQFPVRNQVERLDAMTSKGNEVYWLHNEKLCRRDANFSSHRDCCYLELDSNVEPASEQGKGARFETLDDIRGACWWSEGMLVLLKRSGILTIVTVRDLNVVLELAMNFSCDNLDISHGLPRRHMFLLEDIQVRGSDQDSLKMASENTENSGWRLTSLEEHSVTGLYKILIDSAEFESALLLARRYSLESEIVYKARWMQSDYGLESLQQNLPKIGDRQWVLKECLERVSPSVEAMNGLLQHGLFLVDSCVDHKSVKDAAQGHLSIRFYARRLRLLQYKDRLETYLGLSMGRYSPKDYNVFRISPLCDVAVRLAELGKIGALSFLYKRHMHSLNPYLLKILDAIPETISPHNYIQLLPQPHPPQAYITGRDRDWVEDKGMLKVINEENEIAEQNHVVPLEYSTEHMVRLCIGFYWPSEEEIMEWYKIRARTIDRVSGQLENSLSLLDLGKQKGLIGLENLWEDIASFYQVMYRNIDTDDTEITLSLVEWQQLSDYEKFQAILKGVNQLNVLDRLKEQAIPFMNRKCKKESMVLNDGYNADEQHESFLVKWLKVLAYKNNLQICAAVFSEACKIPFGNWLFESERECIQVGLDCIYSCSRVDQWDLMAAILSKLSFICPQAQSEIGAELSSSGNRVGRSFLRGTNLPSSSKSTNDSSRTGLNFSTSEVVPGPSIKEGIYAALYIRIQQAIDHIEAGRLLSQYQVPKPLGFFESAKNDEKSVKQLIRLLLSKFGRRQPARSDSDWAMMWEDLQKLQARAFPFLNKQILFSEYYRGLLKAGKFSLAKSQLKLLGTGPLIVEKAETVIIQAAREYFYSASSLDSPEIEKARLCLNLLPGSKTITAEMDLIDAVVVKLPALGVSLLPMQVRQMKDPMEIVKMVLNNSSGKGSLKVDEVLDVARLLGINTSDEIAMVEEAIAREAAASGQIGLALNLCLGLIKKGHGAIWDLCAALARGPEFEGLSLMSRKELLGFALSHCDEESIGQLLSSWKETFLLKRCSDFSEALSLKGETFADEESCSKDMMKQFEDCKGFEEEINLEGSREARSEALPTSVSTCTKDWQLQAQAIELENIIPNFEMDQFVSGDEEYIKHALTSLVESAKIKERSELAQVSRVDRYQSLSVRVETDVIECLKLSIPVLQENYNSFKKYLKYLRVKNQWAAVQILLHLTARTMLEAKQGNDCVNEQGLTPVWLLDFWVNLFEDILGYADRDLEDPESRQKLWSLLELKSCCNIFNMLVRAKKVQDIQAQEVIAKVTVSSTCGDQKSLFVKEMISSGCPFQAVWAVWEGTLGEAARSVGLLDFKDSDRDASELHTQTSEILDIYAQVVSSSIDSCLLMSCKATLVEDYATQLESTIKAVSSLGSDFEVDGGLQQNESPAYQMLHEVRLVVWKNLCDFAESLNVPPRLRLCLLKLLEAIVCEQDSTDNVGSFAEYVKNYSIAWDGWEKTILSGEITFSFPKIKNFVVALKSTELLSSEWSDVEVKAEDLLSVEAATLVFDSLAARVKLPQHAALLKILLEEWEGIFGSENNLNLDESVDFATSTNPPLENTEQDGWGQDDWDDVWEETAETRDNSSPSLRHAGSIVHALHACWKIAFEKLEFYGSVEEILTVIDKMSTRNGKILLSKEESIELVSSIAQKSPVSALKLSLLLPYVDVHKVALESFEMRIRSSSSAYVQQNKTREFEERGITSKTEGSSEINGVILVDYCLLTLVLGSGCFSTIAVDPKFSLTFSLLCAQMASSVREVALFYSEPNSFQMEKGSTIQELIFPFFVATLTQTGYQTVASALIMQFMQVHPALITWNASNAALDHFLNARISVLNTRFHDSSCKIELEGSLSCVINTVQRLQSQLRDTLSSAANFLSINVM